MTDQDEPDALLILQRVEAMIMYGRTALRQFPKYELHVLSAEMRRCMWDLLELVIICNKRYHKKTTMKDLDAKVALLRFQLRTAKKFGYLDFKKYEHWSKLNDEIGRMLGGWLRSISISTLTVGDAR